MPARFAPMLHHLVLGLAEIGIVRRNGAAAAEPDAGDAADRGLLVMWNSERSMRYMYSRHFLQHQHVAGEIGLERRAEQLAEGS